MKIKKDTVQRRRATIFITPQLFKHLRIYAIENERSIAECVEEALEDFFKKNPTKKP